MNPSAQTIARHDSQPLLVARDVNVSDGNRQLLQHVNLTVRPGEIVTLIGPNGAGKTTLVKALLGLTALTSGTIERMPGLRVGYMPQRLHLNPMLPISVQRFLRQTGTDATAISHALHETGVSYTQHQSLHTLSGGEMQRVLLARALLRKPDWLVLDEPAQGVDINGQAELYRLIADLRARYHCGVLMVSHDLHLVMAATDTVICLNQHICCQGHPEHVSQHPEYLQLFGNRIAQDIAVYTHRHDHEHDVHGNIVGEHDSAAHHHDNCTHTNHHATGHSHD